MPIRNYTNTSVPVAISAAITASQTNIPVTSTAGFPPVPFTAGLERGTTNEEVVLVTAVVDGTNFTVERGYDGTTGKAHEIGKSFEHCVIAKDYDEANDHVNDAGLHQGAPTGVILPWMGAEASAPTGWLICDGRAVSRETYSALHDLLRDAGGAGSYVYGGGDGATTFNVPDLRGRTIIGLDNMGGSSANRVTATAADSVGGTGGVELVTLTISQMPAHTHVQNPHTHVQNPHHHAPLGGGQFVKNSYPGVEGTSLVTTTNHIDANGGGTTANTTATNQSTTAVNQSTGGGTSHQNMPPFMAATWIIKA